MYLDKMEARTAEKTLLQQCWAGEKGKRITVAETDRALQDQGMSIARRFEIKNRLERSGHLVPPGQEAAHYEAIRATAAPQPTARIAPNVEAGRQDRRVPQTAPNGAWFGAIPKQSDIVAAQHVRSLNAASDYLSPEVAGLLRLAGIQNFAGPRGTLDEAQQEKVLRLAENPIGRKMMQVALYEAGIGCSDLALS